MTISDRKLVRQGQFLAMAVAASLTLAACATTPVSPPGAADARVRLTRLQADPNLSGRAPVAIKEAEAAVQVAEQPLARDPALGAHRVFMAERKVDIAIATASTRYAEDQRAQLSEERQRSRLDARTREADAANQKADAARSDANATRDSAVDAARDAALQASELQRQIGVLQAEATDRGLVMTLGDVLFATGRSDLKTGTTSRLDKLAIFLNQYPQRTARIEGHTDNVGAEDNNNDLSRRRAESVKSYLIGQGIASGRLVASGRGESQPVVENDSAAGRQQNRRVEVIIDNPPAAAGIQSRDATP